MVLCHLAANACCEFFPVCCEFFPICCEIFPVCCEIFLVCWMTFPAANEIAPFQTIAGHLFLAWTMLEIYQVKDANDGFDDSKLRLLDGRITCLGKCLIQPTRLPYSDQPNSTCSFI